MLAQHLLNQQVMGISCMATFTAFPSAIMAACGGLHNNVAGDGGTGSTVVEPIIVDVKAASMAMQLMPITCRFSRCCVRLPLSGAFCNHASMT